MLWALTAIGALALGVIVVELRAAQGSPHHGIVPGVAKAVVDSVGEFSRPAGRPVPPGAATPAGLDAFAAEGAEPDEDQGALKTATAAASLSLVEGAFDFWHADATVLDAYSQLSGDEISNGLDLHNLINDREYKVDTAGFEIKIRGHVAEQEVYDQIRQWNGDGLSVPLASNNAADDGSLDGNPFNIKVGTNSSALSQHLREHPDIPVIVNEDMANLPPDAVHVDLSQPFDTDLLADHSVIVADGLALSDIQDSLADVHGIDLDSFDLSDLGNDMTDAVIPGIGTALLVVRSGVREMGLISEHGDRKRAIKNVGIDATVVGAGVGGGAAAGTALGVLIDVATFGTTGGLGTLVIGPAIGAFGGGFFARRKATKIRTKPVDNARHDASKALRMYDDSVAGALGDAHRLWESMRAESEHRLENLNNELTSRINDVAQRAESDLRQAEVELGMEADRLLANARRVRSSISVGARRRAHRWNKAVDAAATTFDRLDILFAHDATAIPAESAVRQFAVRRLVILDASVEAMRRLILVADLGGRLEVHSLCQSHADLENSIRGLVHPDLERLWMSTARVRFELVATGLRTRDWVQDNLPQIPRPTPTT